MDVNGRGGTEKVGQFTKFLYKKDSVITCDPVFRYDFYLSNEDNPLGFKFPEPLDMKLGAVYVMSVVRNEQKFR